MRRPWLVLFGVAALVELAGVALDSTPAQWLAKPLLAPLLLAYLWDRRRRTDPVAVGLVAATAGDVALLVPGDTAFLAGMGCFLVTQLAFLTAFLRHRRPPVAAVAGYLLAWAGANALLWSALGPLRLPVLGYSLALSLMAAAATGVSRRTAAGGALFLVSDLLIGVGAAGGDFPGRDLLVMTTYAAALLLITAGWAAAHAGPTRPVQRYPIESVGLLG
ncbi:lysoplasmalogenase [Micromonospora terminaliae]|uniref:Lysoplasmalogenase n=1 Tax=Micromonospora terminaliae TaxID=1914461 RepID=A0AAJ3DKU0_9ACTN|nr:lysoplasmalogenase [Micromonospora terminaliae]NES27455.1 lysoplasmalogenase [Micromonospora terminaliae]QGL47804.1 lysoplasmalogenase [Micromonospora terminaliae]